MESKQTTIRLPVDLLTRADDLIDYVQARTPLSRVRRSDVLRMAIHGGLMGLELERRQAERHAKRERVDG